MTRTDLRVMCTALGFMAVTLKGEKLPEDPWGRPFVYRSPSQRPGHEYDLLSLGPTGQPGGSGQLASAVRVLEWAERLDASGRRHRIGGALNPRHRARQDAQRARRDVAGAPAAVAMKRSRLSMPSWLSATAAR